jgi:ATP-dependent helicase/nuclease subunit A
MSPLKIYKASAGSGKTFALTMAYLKLLFTKPGIFRHILAVTFTNKAAGEMKQRILGRLHCLSTFGGPECAEELKQLKELTGLDEEKIRIRAGELLKEILNNYSAFSVGTIDKFFQSVIRAFTHEIGIQPAYNLELDHRRVLSLAVDKLFQDLGNQEELQDWLVRYALERMESSLSWDFRREMIQLGEQLFKESFQELFLQENFAPLNKKNLDLFLSEMTGLEEQVRLEMRTTARQALELMGSLGLHPEDFKGAGKSPAMLFVSASEGRDLNFTSAKIAALTQSDKWLKKNATAEVETLTRESLLPLLQQNYKQQEVLNTLAAVHTHFYTLGILGDIREYVQEYTRERNLFLIADSGRFLRGIIGSNQVPFIYERTGSRYSHIMLDEFQDTSLFQYDNFRPLLDNSLAAGEQSLVVGDVKQSIYRWRNSDWKILASDLELDFAHQEIRVEPLKENYRSRDQIVRFNNSVFQLSSSLLAEIMEKELLASSAHQEEIDREVQLFRSAWRDVVQKIPAHLENTGGRVRAELFDTNEAPFSEQLIKSLPSWVDELLETGIEAGEIAILVRTRKEGVLVANALLEHARNSGRDRSYKLVSNDSLLLGYNASVSLLISLLRYLHHPEDAINNTLLKYQLNRLEKKVNRALDLILDREVSPDELLPGEFLRQEAVLKQLPLYELIESLIDLLDLGTRANDLPYLQAFQDLVIDLQRRGPMGIGEFLDYWEQTGAGKSLSFSEASDAIRIITIHKAKGLEFKAVIVPFCDWDLTTDARNANILWCPTENTPLDRIPVVPLRFGSKMTATLFSSVYYSERMKGYMDRLNLMYVAFTRARDILYIGLPKREVQAVKNTGDLMQAIAQQEAAEKPCTGILADSMQNGVISLGSLPAYQQEAEGEDPWKFTSYPVNGGQQQLKVHMRSDQYFLDEEGALRTGRMYGNLMHELFSLIDTVDDVNDALGSMQRKGLLPEKEASGLSEHVREMISRPEVSDWFTLRENRYIFKERSLLCSSGLVLRPDRVIVEGDRAIVIDFKFGEIELSSYHKQLSEYMNELKRMGYQKVEAYLWYVMLGRISKIHEQ